MDSLLSVKQVAGLLGLSVASIWRLTAREDAGFPKPIRLRGCRATRWRAAEVKAWQDAVQ
jgi:predicted DNA-binding transcriptional regulator AlpA